MKEDLCKWMCLLALLFGVSACKQPVRHQAMEIRSCILPMEDSLSNPDSWSRETIDFMLRPRSHYNTLDPATYPLRMLYVDPLSDHLWNEEIWKDSL